VVVVRTWARRKRVFDKDGVKAVVYLLKYSSRKSSSSSSLVAFAIFLFFAVSDQHVTL
jgi:hypothetical protein